MNLRTPLTALAAAAALGLVACGGDDKPSGLDKTALAKQAGAVCKTANDASDKVTVPENFGTTDGSPQEAAAYLTQIATITHTELDGLKALTPQKDLKPGYDALLAKETELATFVDGLVAKAKAVDKTGLEDLKRAEPLGKEFTALAAKAGIPLCEKG